ncbi:MAG TPA: substrate-binding domain-containing protein [Symbiobacteriaceae bacterium]|nr:substrate-binding domain-containing protein [Symbiobacteriaceae bacterium]
MVKRLRTLLAAALIPVLAACGPTPGSKGEMILSTTTSTQDSGLLEVLVPQFEKETGYKVKVIAVGSGQALAMGERGEADALLTHAPASEKPLVDSGAVVNYELVMHNDFVVVGPAADPAKVMGTKTAAEALKAIAGSKNVFVSRSDNSGTHKAELELWKAADVQPAGDWYLKSGTGMGQTLTIASEKNGYTLTDRATFLAQMKNLQLKIVLEGDKPLLNIYHVMQTNPAKFEKVKGAAGEAFVKFMLKKESQQTIAKFGVDKYGQPLFFADALEK